ncbi:MAG: T9SS type A sorting domain-containing protein [Candidatus Cloacimonetes bacterium]|nr:T9SS type A sorting domain-containing protein [Candidatus Cloacimonadota bacterium]MBL7086156.1 T9SS type A sorting domain-containing protein [Candidatus Cloacimonadota bacterium]
MMQFANDSSGKVWICYRFYSYHPYDIDQIKINYADGDTWAETPMVVASYPIDDMCNFPDIIIDDADKVWVTWEVPNNNQNYISARYYDHGIWSDTSFVSVDAERAGYPNITKDNSDHIFCMWFGTSGMESGFYVNHCDAGSNAIEEPNMPIEEPYIHLSAYPNPFHPVTCINFSLNKEGYTTLKIFNIKGQLIKTLVNEYKRKGDYSILWDGKNKDGKEVSSGIYLYRVQVENHCVTRSLNLVK